MLAVDQALPATDRRHRTLTRDAFVALCAECGGVSSPDALLGFLHRSGVVFHRPGLFGDRVVVDQQWALDAVYALLDRARALPALRGRGRFTRADLEWVAWRGYTADEQRVFLGMMEACGICFRAGGGADPEYVAPDLLPGLSEARRDLLAGRVPRTPPDATAVARFRFLHDGVLRALLCRVGRRAGDHASYWRYGCWFYEATTDGRVVVEADPGAEGSPAGGAVMFRAWGPDPVRLLEPLLAAAAGASPGRPPEVTRSWAASPAPPADEADAPVVVPAVERLVPAAPPDPGGRAVAISYAHGDDRSDAGRLRGRVADELYAHLEGWGYRVLRDRDAVRNGDLIREFMLRLGRAERVVVVLSDKYLRSVYCMTELHHVFQFALGQPGRFADRVVPVVLDDASVDDWRSRKGWAEHWDAEYRAMEAANHHLGAQDRALCLQIRRWVADVGDMLGLVAGVAAPRGYAAVSAGGYRAVREMLERPPAG